MAARPMLLKHMLRWRLRSQTADGFKKTNAAGLRWEADLWRGTEDSNSAVGVKSATGHEIQCKHQSVNSSQIPSRYVLYCSGRSFLDSTTFSRCFVSQSFDGFKPSKRFGLAASLRQPYSPGEFLPARQQHTDDFLAQRAVAERNRRQTRFNIRSRQRGNYGDGGSPDDFSSEADYETSEGRIAGVLGRPDLIVTRNVEWANIALGFEQQNRYVIMDPREPQAPVGYILEDSSVLLRQLLRTRRPFTAQVLDGDGVEICQVRRPAWFINSTIFVEVDGMVVGEAHRRWHLWRRVYDCYLGSKQFAAVENPGFWYWTFVLHDKNDGVLAVIDRNWRGFGFEFLTDAGQYVVRFGESDPYDSSTKLRPRQRVSHEDVLPNVSRTTTIEGGMLRNVQATADAEPEDPGLTVARPLSMVERAVTLALAVSLDNDYFSRHSAGFGFIPIPFFGGEEIAEGSVASAESDGSENIKVSDGNTGGFFSD